MLAARVHQPRARNISLPGFSFGVQGNLLLWVEYESDNMSTETDELAEPGELGWAMWLRTAEAMVTLVFSVWGGSQDSHAVSVSYRTGWVTLRIMAPHPTPYRGTASQKRRIENSRGFYRILI